MYRTLIQHEWKSLRRSPFWTRSLLQLIGLGFLALYFLVGAIGLGFSAGYLIEELYPEGNVVNIFSAFFILYLLVDLIFRFLIQKYPSIGLKKYLTLNISKTSLSHFIVLKSTIHFFNFLPLFTVVPFFFLFVLSSHSVSESLSWLVTIFTFILINNFLSYYIDRQFGKQPIVAIILLSIVSALLFLEYNGHIQFVSFLESITYEMYFNWIGTVVLIFLLVAVYYLLFNLLRSNAYIDSGDSLNNSENSNISFSIFNQFGEIGKWMQLESKLIWRNKKPRQYLYMSFLFMLYPFVIGLDTFKSYGLMIFLGIFLTGMFIMNYGQLLLSWNSAHFNLILTQNFPLHKYLKSKYYLLTISCVVLSFIALPYGYFNIKFLLIIVAMCFYNIGITIPIYLFLAVHTAKRIDLKKGSMFNYEGLSISHFLIIIPVMAPPLLVFLIFYLLKMPDIGIIFLGVIGIAGIILHEKIIEWVIKKFHERKYILQVNLNTKQ